MKIGCIGTGAMGGAIMRAVCKKYDVSQIKVTDKNAAMGKAFAKETGATFVNSNKDVLDCDYIFLAVKPQFLGDVFDEIGRDIPNSAVVISMVAGVKIEKLEQWVHHGARFIRMMPNVCAQIGEGMTAIAYNSSIKEDEAKTALEILSTAGRVEVVQEKLMDCVTALGGSGPAFVFMFIEALADGAVRCGMPRTQAYTYAAQVVYGSAGMVMESGKNPAALKDMVCSPAGTTIEGVAVLEKNGFRNAVIEAITAACNRSIELGK